MRKRVLTGIVLVAVLGLFFGLRQINTYLFDILLGVILICASGEVSRVFIRSNHYNNMTLVTLFPVFYYLGFLFTMQKELNFGYFLLIELGILAVFTLICVIWTLLDKKSRSNEQGEKSFKKYFWSKVFLTLFIMVYPTFLLGNMFILNHSADIGWFSEVISSILGLFLLILTFASTMLTDTFAYFVGSAVRGPKLCPFISPNKTISGAFGGLAGGIIAGLVAFAVANGISEFSLFFSNNNITIWIFLLYGVISSIVTQVGDIFASWLKRKARTKDFSSIFPGHGGFMDRCDGLSFNALITLPGIEPI